MTWAAISFELFQENGVGYGVESFGKVNQKTAYKIVVGKESGSMIMMENKRKASMISLRHLTLAVASPKVPFSAPSNLLPILRTLIKCSQTMTYHIMDMLMICRV
jgi:hypothetical protein